MRGLALAFAVAAVGCVESSSSVCGSVICDPGLVCVSERGACYPPGDVSACDGLAQGAQCTSATGDGVCDRGVCTASPCGDGVIDPALGEVCDDGNASDGDGCDSSCTIANCLAIPASAGDLARPIADVLDDPACDDTVFVSPGTYLENLVIDRDVDVVGGNSDVVIDGGQNGPTITVTDSSITLQSLTITGGDGKCGGGIFSDSADVLLLETVVTENSAAGGAGICQVGGSVIISGSQISNNVALGSRAIGGGVAVSRGTLTVRSGSEIVGNRARGSVATGGAIESLQSSVVLAGRCVVADNSAESDGTVGSVAGGAISLFQSDLTVGNCELRNNRAESVGGPASAFGGAIYASALSYGGGLPSVIRLDGDSVVRDNVVRAAIDARGGGIFLAGGVVALDGSVIASNQADASRAMGGGIRLEAEIPTSLTASETTIRGNRATSVDGDARAGGVSLRSAPSTVTFSSTDSALIENEAQGPGGAIHVSGSVLVDVNLVNTTVSGNRATSGGAITVLKTIDIMLSLFNSTVTGNTGTAGAFDLGAITGADEVLVLANSIIFGNQAPECVMGASALTGDFNVIGDQDSCPAPGAVAIDSDPLLGPLADNGGPTLTHLPADGSVAIGAGDPEGCEERLGRAIGADQRGFKRGDVGCHIGSVERGATPAP